MVTIVLVTALVSALVGGCMGAISGASAYFVAKDADGSSAWEDSGEWEDDSYEFDPEVLDGPDEFHGVFEFGGSSAHHFEVPLPDDVTFVEVTLTGGDRDLDLFATLDREGAESGDWEIVADSASGDEFAWFARFDQPLLGNAPLFLELQDLTGGDDDHPYVLEFLIARRSVTATLSPGPDLVRGATEPENGHRVDYEIVLPAGEDVIRVDLVDARQDLELAVDASAILDPKNAALLSDSMLGRDWLVIDRGELRLDDGDQTLSLVVVDHNWLDRRVRFELLVTSGADAPPMARRVPSVLTGTTPEERAAGTVVAIMTEGDEGSGVVVRGDGTILTAAHLFDDLDDDVDEVYVLITDDPRREPIEAYRGRVLRRDADLDLAIVKLTMTLHGDPLPDDFAMLATTPRWDTPARLAERVHAVGYPVLHDSSERSELTWTSGILAGFETPLHGDRLRFDAEIRGGSSGGALLDDQMRLLGITVAVHEDTQVFSATGLATPVTEIPDEWLPLLR